MKSNITKFVLNVLDSMPDEWTGLTTHRLDIYNENKAKIEFLEEFEALIDCDPSELSAKLNSLPTAYDYIRLGHPLSCVLEWTIGKLNNIDSKKIITFSSKTMGILSILRKNALSNTNTQIITHDKLPSCFDQQSLRDIYGYKFEVKTLENMLPDFDGSTIHVKKVSSNISFKAENEFFVAINEYGSIVIASGDDYISEIQHVRRRESIAMTPRESIFYLKEILESFIEKKQVSVNHSSLVNIVKDITGTNSSPLFGSCGLSVQYAIMMGLVDYSFNHYPNKPIKFIVPPNCYGGTNDQARRVADCLDNVEVLDLPVDSGSDMVQSTERILNEVAHSDGVPFIIAEIPTNPRVEVPHLESLRECLLKERKTQSGDIAVAPVFILDQTFCPNVKFLGAGEFLDGVSSISYVSGSKFPSGGLCTAGYCVANKRAEDKMDLIEKHMKICDNGATKFQLKTLTEQMPSMLTRIRNAYSNTRKFVDFISKELPSAKINFVSEELADSGFTPSVFSLDLPTIGETHEERETYKRDLNLKLINLMINEIPDEAKFCVSYGQLKGSYWTIPATSTQGTTKEGDKDYIVRVSLSGDMDLKKHKEVFEIFCSRYIKS